ncbi:MAG: LamG domain-containing protein [Verrucomicrobia bacterium]|nr:LamG domain-containing protein [Verrucomicrobiota bacterium]
MKRQTWILRVALIVSTLSALAAEKDGLVAHYTFDEGSGTVAADKSGNMNDGTIHGMDEFVKVGAGYALRFDGKTTCVDCGSGKSLNNESAGTITCWFQAEAEPQGGLITRSTSSAWADERCVLSFRTPGGLLVWAMGDGKESQFRQFPDTKAETWTHVALTWDSTSIIFYRDGQRIGVEALELTPKFKDVPLIIGRSQGLGEPFFKGLIDEARVYNRALTAQEIAEQFTTGKR